MKGEPGPGQEATTAGTRGDHRRQPQEATTAGTREIYISIYITYI